MGKRVFQQALISLTIQGNKPHPKTILQGAGF